MRGRRTLAGVKTLPQMPAPAGSLARIALAGSPAPSEPIAFPLPQRGGDPYWHLSRSTWYALEKSGLIRFLRIRLPGNIRGRVLIDYQQASEALRKLAADNERKTEAAAAS